MLKAIVKSYKKNREYCDLNECRTCPVRKVCDGIDTILFGNRK